MKKYHVVCFSGGGSSARIALYLSKLNTRNIILLNHDINPRAELEDVKRFKKEVADLCGLEITYANMEDWDKLDQFDVAENHGGIKFSATAYTCTKHMKTLPFANWIKDNQDIAKNAIFYYGFDDTSKEIERSERRKRIMNEMGGYEVRFVLQEDSNIEPCPIRLPSQYSHFKHANCIGCFKGGSQHWYVVYCLYPEVWGKAKALEEKELSGEVRSILSSTITKDGKRIKVKKFLKDIECDFSRMKAIGIEPTEHIPSQTFWSDVKKRLAQPNLFDYETWKTDCDCMVG